MHLEAEPLGRDCVAYANIDLCVEGRTVKTVLFHFYITYGKKYDKIEESKERSVIVSIAIT